MRKNVTFIADSLDNAYKFQQVLASLGASVQAGSTMQIRKLLAPDTSQDLIIFEARGSAKANLDEVRQIAERRPCPLLLIVNEEDIDLVPSSASLPWDFIVHGASEKECAARVRLLLSDEAEAGAVEVVNVDSLTINLATYQVTVDGEPIDFTYLEYALLAYLAQHPGHTFSRDVLLQHVWGFDYYGGSRTVDVHVRRIRAKLGPELAQHLETVRGVGYLWNP